MSVSNKAKQKIKPYVSSTFSFMERVTGYKYERLRARKKLGYKPDIKNPHSFNEKVIWKKIHDRNPLLPLTADKFKARRYVQLALGREKAEKILVPFLYSFKNPKDIIDLKINEDVIFKPNNASHQYIIVERQAYDWESVVKKSKEWLCNTNYGWNRHEWVYSNIEPYIIVEKILRDENGELPEDYKFFMIHGKCYLIQVDFNRFGEHTRSLFSPDWRYLDVKKGRPKGPAIQPPFNLNRMHYIAEVLSRPFDFVRVDLYSVKGHVYFSELTHYPGSGLSPFTPGSFDKDLGKHWKIIPDYWERSAVCRSYINKLAT